MVLSALPPTHPVFISADDWLGLSFRLTMALLVGGAIGWNRQATGKPAGLRTHMLVSLGAALFVLLPLLASTSTSIDTVSRAIQGVATGVGFLGAGEILHQSGEKSSKPNVKGLTSAATIWLTAALGMIAGCGFWQLSLLSTLMTLLILTAAKKLERVVFHRND
ncbi:MAG TPA: MgtC/SapB family protein [Candidatus Sericytochromatia bacterium]